MSTRALAWLSVAVLAGVAPALAQHSHHGVARLGTVEFKVTCSPAAQQQFHTAMALYHSFAWPQATAAF